MGYLAPPQMTKDYHERSPSAIPSIPLGIYLIAGRVVRAGVVLNRHALLVPFPAVRAAAALPKTVAIGLGILAVRARIAGAGDLALGGGL